MVPECYRTTVDQKIDTANAVHLLRNLTVKNRQPKWFDLDLLPDPFFDVRLSRKPGIKIRAAWKFGKHDGSDHITDIIENRAGRAQLAPFYHRLDTREVSRPCRRAARFGVVVGAIVGQQQKLHNSAPYPSSLATRAKLQTRPSVSTRAHPRHVQSQNAGRSDHSPRAVPGL